MLLLYKNTFTLREAALRAINAGTPFLHQLASCHFHF